MKKHGGHSSHNSHKGSGFSNTPSRSAPPPPQSSQSTNKSRNHGSSVLGSGFSNVSTHSAPPPPPPSKPSNHNHNNHFGSGFSNSASSSSSYSHNHTHSHNGSYEYHNHHKNDALIFSNHHSHHHHSTHYQPYYHRHSHHNHGFGWFIFSLIFGNSNNRYSSGYHAANYNYVDAEPVVIVQNVVVENNTVSTFENDAPPSYETTNSALAKPNVKNNSAMQYGIDAYNNKDYNHAQGYFTVVLNRTKKVANRESAKYYLCRIALRQGNLIVAQRHSLNTADLYNQILEHSNEATDLSKLDYYDGDNLIQKLDEVAIAIQIAEEALAHPDLSNNSVKLNEQIDVLKRIEVDLLVRTAEREVERLRSEASCLPFGHARKAYDIEQKAEALKVERDTQKPGSNLPFSCDFKPLLTALKAKRTNWSLSLTEASSWTAVPGAVRKKLRG